MDKVVESQKISALEEKMELLLKTGQLLIQSGADSNRIDRNMRRIAVFLGILPDDFHMHITVTTLMVSIADGVHSVTKFKKCLRHSVNMAIISQVSRLSWDALENQYSLEDFDKALNRIGSGKHVYPRWLVVIGVGIACACFCKLFGCDWIAMFVTALGSSIALFCRQEMHKLHVNVYMNIAVSAFIAVLITGAFALSGWSLTPNHPIFATVLFLVPGVPMINALDDMIDGFTIVGLTRGIVAFLMITSISFGMTLGLKVLSLPYLDAKLIPQSIWAMIAVYGSIAATGFAMLFNVPLRLLFICSLGGAIAVVTRNFLMYEFLFSLPLSSFFGAFSVGVFCMFWVHKLDIPGHVVSIPSVIPMIPGVFMYRAIIGFLSLDGSDKSDQITLLFNTIDSGMKAFLTLLGIALGVTIPNIINRFFSAKLKHKRIVQAVESREKENNNESILETEID